MALVNRVAQGLLALLDTKSQGQTPNEISTEIRPTIDVTDYYGWDTLEQVDVAVSGVTAVGRYAPLVVPPGELWRVLAIQADGLMIIAGRATLYPGVRGWPGATNIGNFNFGEQIYLPGINQIVSDKITQSQVFSPALLLGAGGSIETEVTSIVTSTLFITTRALIQRLSL